MKPRQNMKKKVFEGLQKEPKADGNQKEIKL